MKKIFFLLCVILLFFVNSLFAQKKIFTSIQPLAFLIENIGREKVKVFTMLREGDNPHTFEPLPAQITELNKADMYIKLGSGIEFELIWLDKIFNTNKSMKIADASRGIKLLKMQKHAHNHDKKEKNQHHHSNNDPHIWLSIANAIIMSANIRDALISIDTDNSEYYRSNFEQLIGELNNIKNQTQEKLKNVKNRKFLIFHPSFGYFANEFNLTQLAIEIDGKEPTPKQLKQIINTAKKNNIKIVLASENFNKKSAELIAKEIDGRVELINELSKDYINNLKKITAIFAETLK